MKTTIGILVLALCTNIFTAQAQRTVTTTRATSYDISDNLDLEAVASIFGQSKNLEDFEYRLNDPDTRISNLDLNQDGYIDYLRVLENSSDQNSVVVVQAVLDKDVYQDVATIEIERVYDGNHRIQIVGNDYIYGSNYFIEPIFVRRPLIFTFFWGPRYASWSSPYYWNYYPRWYSYYRPYPTYKYHRYVYGNIDRHNTYRHTDSRFLNYSSDRYNNIRRDDYASKNPGRSFENRHEGISNKNELNRRRSENSGTYQRNSDNIRNNDRQNQNSRSKQPAINSERRQGNEYRRPSSVDQSGSNRTNNRENNNLKSGSNNVRVQPNTDSGRRSYEKPEVSRRQSAPKETPNKNYERTEQPRRSAEPAVRSSSSSNENKSRSTSRSSSGNVNSSESKKTDNKSQSKERRNR